MLDAFRHRSLERGVLLLSTFVVATYTAALALAAPAIDRQWPCFGAAVVLGTFWTVHLVLVFRRHRGDELLLPIAALLVGLSCIEIDRLEPAQAYHQTIWLVVSVVAMFTFVASIRDYRRLEDYKYLMLVSAIALQVAVMLFGTRVNGARLWIRFGPFFQFQPVEFVKLLLIGFLAAYLRQNRDLLTLGFGGEERRITLRYLWPLLLVAVCSEFIFVVQRDLGQGLLFFGVFLSMYFVATRRLGVVLLSLLAFLGMSWICYHLFAHVRVRFENWLDPWKHATTTGYQMVCALYSLASGGWCGSGVWRGQPWRTPAASTDFIFVSIAEEMGTVVAVAIVACFAILVVRAFRVARAASNDFGSLLACGVGATLACQVFVIVAGTIRMIPMTGITLPFMSYGGTSLVANFLMLGLLLEISHNSEFHAPEPRFDAGVRALTWCAVLLLVAPVLYLLAFQMQDGERLAEAVANPRNRDDMRACGAILDRTGRRLAWTASTGPGPVSPPWLAIGPDAVRRYARGREWGNLVGYRSAVYGLSGLEASLNHFLAGTIDPHNLWQALEEATGRDLRGDNVVLTVDAALQRLAWHEMAGRRGAVVALDPRNGAILAMVSSPGFDSASISRAWRSIVSSASAPLLNRAVCGLYPPGSVIKPVVVAEALDAGVITTRDTFDCPGYLVVDGKRMRDAQGEVHGHIDVTAAVAESCNVALGHIAMRMGVARFLHGLRMAGLGTASAPGLSTLPGHLPKSAEVTRSMLAQMGFGQGPLLVTPLQVALYTAGLANHGVIEAPHIVSALVTPTGGRADVAPRAWRTMCSKAAARAVVPMMEAVVAWGTGTQAQLPGVTVAGKTGTAENPHGQPHAWFVGFAPALAPRIVVAVVVENGGWGASVAAPIARDVMRAALALPRRR